MVKKLRRMALYARRREAGALLLEVLPRPWKATMAAHLIGELTATDPRLHSREVPTITVQELLNAMPVYTGTVS